MADETSEKTLKVPKITSVVKTEKPKDPKRVAAGKRLAQISKAAKGRKARERLAVDFGVGGGRSAYYGYIIGTVGLIIGGASLYYTMRQEKREIQRLKTVDEEKVMEGTVVRSESQNPVRTLPVLDTLDK